MITRKKEHWFRMFFMWHGSVLPKLLPRLILLLLLSVAVVYFHGSILSFKIPLNPVPFTLFGFALALFLGFRNNVSYERFEQISSINKELEKPWIRLRLRHLIKGICVFG